MTCFKIRRASEIPFTQLPSDPPILGLICHAPDGIAVADVRFEPDTPLECLTRGPRVMFGPGGFLVYVPTEVPVDNIPLDKSIYDVSEHYYVYRIGFLFEHTESSIRNDPKLVCLSHLQEVLNNNYFPMPGTHAKGVVPKIKEVIWTSTFRNRYCIAETFVKQFSNGGHVILAGDSAHNNSPAGGQGMNVGMCDGLEAGIAIANHTTQGDSEILKKYNDLRMKVAAQTIEMTRKSKLVHIHQ
jgi:2-polyprenyl-6-methoxyphenol hydroxylase-like FAD-dependent oxidoreductase